MPEQTVIGAAVLEPVFAFAPPGTVLITYRDYLFAPGVLLYDFVGREEGGNVIGLALTLGLLMSRQTTLEALSRSRALITTGRQVDQQRFRIAASIAPVGIGLAGLGVGALAVGGF